MFKTIFYGVISLDGYLAAEGGEMGWAEKYLSEDEDFGWMELISSSGSVLMGRKTFEFELQTTPELDRILPTYVLTEQPLKFDGLRIPNLHFISGDLREVVATIKAKHPGHLFVGGGAMLVDTLLVMGLIDELRLFIAPDILSSGIRLFKGSTVREQFNLIQSKSYASGLTELRLEKQKN
ncbi:dihydrofolate reductase [Aquiluna borgnonia]|jgi:dihydrofolate reductase|uniref:Dihydrofolate reductase n=1 Tax=Aquiluna borgnonia TaxID=2499157 RepID=A0A7D4QBX1_9MICO|nr:dihydrofolate reductase family protein [Aquiluna borgnonia]QKJ25570.1 dihydrofolate reductase [Aquiluna borgnonia]